MGVEAVCRQCLLWRKAHHPEQAAWGGRSNGQGSSVAPKGFILGEPLSLVISRHSLVLEQILRSSPSTTASVIFLGFKKKKTNQEALRHVRR